MHVVVFKPDQTVMHNPQAGDSMSPSPSFVRKIWLKFRKPEENQVALPTYSKQLIETDTDVTPKVKPRTYAHTSGQSPTSIAGSEAVNHVLNAILDSMIDLPDQTDEERVAESKRIAAQLGVTVQSLAAVRANFTRGTYGDPEVVLATRKSYLAKKA